MSFGINIHTVYVSELGESRSLQTMIFLETLQSPALPQGTDINTATDKVLFRTLRSHNSSAKELANKAKPIFATLQLILEKVVLTTGLDLSLPNCFDRRILRSTDWTLHVVRGVEASLVKGVFAQEMYRGKIQVAAAGGTTAGLEDDRLIFQFIYLLPLSIGF